MSAKQSHSVGRHRSVAMLAFAAAALLTAPSSGHADVLYVSNANDNTVKKFTPDGVGSVFANTASNDPRGLAFDSQGNLYVANWSDNTVHKFTPDGIGSTFASGGLNGPSGLAFDTSGNLYVANSGNHTIEKFTPGGVGSVFANDSLRLNDPQGLAFDSQGNLYVASWSDSRITKFTPDGIGSTFASGGLNGPGDLAFDSSGNLYVVNTGDNTIERFTPGGVGSVFANTGLNGPEGLAFDSQGNLYVSNWNNNTIEKFTPGGTGSVFASAGLSGPRFMAFRPAPQPTVDNIAATNIGMTTATIGAQVTAAGASNQTATVTICYDTVDGGTNTGNWAHSISLGSQSGAATTNLTGLTQGTLYYFRAFVTNSAGSSWASSSASFTTLQIIVDNIAATNIGAATATIGAQVTGSGASNQTTTVTIYYGTADGGTNAGGWARSVSLGLQSGTATTNLTGLTQNTLYYFRAFATNSAGSSWASSSASFTTLQIVPPTVANIPATGIGCLNATVGVQVISTGNQNPTVKLYYGTTDGGTSAGSWAHVASFGVRSGTITTNLTGLTPDALYYFRAYAINVAGSAWAPATASFTLLSSDIFTMGLAPATTNILAGLATNVTAKVTLTNLSPLLSGTITNSLTVTPAGQGVTASLNTYLPYVAFGGGTSNLTLTISATAAATPGVYHVVALGSNALFAGNIPVPGAASVTYTVVVVTNLNPVVLRPFPLSANQRGTVACLENPSISYDVYLPPGYTTNGNPLPILYTFSPGGGGEVSSYQTVCASLNIITIGMLRSANGVPYDIIFQEDYAVARDLRQRVLFDPTAEFAAGFSGGGEASYGFSRMWSQHVAGILANGGWLGRMNNGGAHVDYYGVDRVQTNLLVARTTGTSDSSTIFYNPFDSNYLATCGAVIQDWSFSGGHQVAPDSVKTACLSWLLSQRVPPGLNDNPFDAASQAAAWRSRITAGQSESVLRECVATLMSQPRTWNAFEAQLVMDDLMTNYTSFRMLSVSNLAQGDFAADLFYFAARGAALNHDWQRYYGNLKALTGIAVTNGLNGTITITGITVTAVIPTTNGSISITGTPGDRAGDIYDLLTEFSYPAPILQSVLVPIAGTPGQMSVWLREDVPGLSYALQYRSSASSGTWRDLSNTAHDTNTIWSVGISLPPYPGWRFYRVSTAPVPSSSPPWP